MTLDKFREATKDMPGDARIVMDEYNECGYAGRFTIDTLTYDKNNNEVLLQ